MPSRLRAEMTASDSPQQVVRIRRGLPSQVQAVVAPTAHAVLPEQPGVLFAIVGRVDHLRDPAGPDVEGWIVRPASADLAPTDPLLYRNFASAEQKCLISGEIQVKPDLKLLRQPRDIRQVLDIVPHDGEVHADLQPKTLPLGDQVPEVADRRVKGASPAADMIVDALVRAVHRYVEAPDPGGKHLFEYVRGQADSIRVQMHMPDASSVRIGHNLKSVRADQRLAAGEVCLDYPQPHELIYDVLPFLDRQLPPGILQPAGAADASQVAILSQEQLGDERPDMNIGRDPALDSELDEKTGEMSLLRDSHYTFLAATKIFAEVKVSPSR